MSRFDRTLPAKYFDDLYAADPDPWRFAASAYERDKYAATLAALPRSRYTSALEIGCSIGVLTRQVAAHCDSLLSLDVAQTALEQAALRCADLPHVTFSAAQVPGSWPPGRFDLILLSEVIYYLDLTDVARLAARVGESLGDGGDIVLVHWLGETHYPLTGDAAAEYFIRSAAPFARVLHQSRTDSYRLDVLRASNGRSPDGAR